MLISMLMTLLIIMFLLTGGTPTLGDVLLMVAIGVPGFALIVYLRNRFAEGFVTTFLGMGAPAMSSADVQTDEADGYVQQQQYDAALFAYEQALRKAKGAQRAPLMLRLAETAMLADHPDEALRWWRHALQQKKGLTDEQRARTLFRMAEVLRDREGDLRGAAQLLAQVQRDHPGSKFASYAEERLRDMARERRPH